MQKEYLPTFMTGMPEKVNQKLEELQRLFDEHGIDILAIEKTLFNVMNHSYHSESMPAHYVELTLKLGILRRP